MRIRFFSSLSLSLSTKGIEVDCFDKAKKKDFIEIK